MTPNYLGFLQATPKESPLEAGIESGMQTYSDVESLRQKTYQTQAMPKDIEQKQQEKQEDIEKKSIELQHLPEQLDQEAQQRALILQYLPQQLKNQITTEQLNQAHLALQNKITSMGVDQMSDTVKNGELAKIYQAKINHPDNPDIVNEQYQASRKRLAALGYSLPEQPNDNIFEMGHDAFKDIDANNHFTQQMALLGLAQKGKADIAQQKKTVFENESEKTVSDTYNKEFPVRKQSADTILTNLDDLEKNIQLTNWVVSPYGKGSMMLGYARGSWFMNDPHVGQVVSDVNNIVTAKLPEVIKNMRGTNALLNVIQQGKIDPEKDSEQTMLAKIPAIRTGAQLENQYISFASAMIQQGIHDINQINEAWSNFTETKPFVDEKGNYNPEGPKQWARFFQQHPEKLPKGILQQLADNQKYGVPQTSINSPQTSQNTNDNQYSLQAAINKAIVESIFGTTNSLQSNGGIISDFRSVQDPTTALVGQ